MARITINHSILTLNNNGLNSPINRHQLANWIKKENPPIYYLQEPHLIDRNNNPLAKKGGRRIIKLMVLKNKQEYQYSCHIK
jgi:exonuclease III